MPAYRYEALDAQGRTLRGVHQAESEKAVRAWLRAQQRVPMQVSAVGGGAAGAVGGEPAGDSVWTAAWRRAVFTRTALTVWTRQLSGLLEAGLPLERALSVLADEAPDERQRALLGLLQTEVQAGTTFARALESAPREFNEIYRAVVSAGEQSGALAAVMTRLADDLEAQQALRAKVVAASLYPAIVSGVALLIVLFLLTYVVPQIAAVFSTSQHALPLLTVVMLGLSRAAREWGLLGLVGLGLAGAAFVVARRQAPIRLRLDAAWLRLPLLGRLAQGYNAARFASTLALLAGAGVPILRALQTAAHTLHNRALRADALEALARVREGAPLGSALAARKRFPALLPVFARLGEQTGQLPAMLDRAAQQLASDVQRRALALATALEPALVVGMGAVVMLIVLAVLLPIIQMNTWVR